LFYIIDDQAAFLLSQEVWPGQKKATEIKARGTLVLQGLFYFMDQVGIVSMIISQ